MASKTLVALALLVVFGFVNAVPFYDDTIDTEFVPLEQQGRAEHKHPEETLFNVNSNTNVGSVNHEEHNPNVFFQQSFPLFGPDFFNTFGGFGIGTQREPWWKGVNVCTEKKEDEKAEAGEEDAAAEPAVEEITPGVSGTVDVRRQLFGQFHLSLNSCVEKPNKYVCTSVVSKNGKKKTVSITRQCCHGYGRARNADYSTPCEKIEIKSIEETAANMGAKEFIASANSNGLTEMLKNSKNITIFMPMDSAFANRNEQLQNNVIERKEGDAAKNLFLRHIVNGEYYLDDVSNEQVLKTQKEGETIRINMYQLPYSLNSKPFRYTANCIPIEKQDQLSEQGLVHAIDGVMKPISKNIMDIIRERADMSIMRTVLENTKISEMLEKEGPVTIFVPTDDAFEKLEPHLRRALKEGKGCASNILKNHILDLTFCSVASVPGAKTTAYNLLGEPMRFNRSKTVEEKSEVADLVGEEPVIINGKAKIIEADIMGTNGVMHVIDTILPTQTALPMSTLLQEKNVTIFKRLLEAAGVDYKFDDMENATVFAPTDKALQDSKWAKLLTESPEQLKDNAELLEFLNYHVIHPMIKTCDLTEKLLPTVAGPKVRLNLYSTHTLFSDVMNRATVNCARLVHFDDESCGSVLHQVDRVLEIPKMTLLEKLESNNKYSKFLELVRKANLTSLLSNMDNQYTLLIPKDDIFTEFEDWEQTLAKESNGLDNLIKSHIVKDVVCCAGIIPTNWPFVRTVEALTGVHLRITRDRRPKIEQAGIIKCDTIAVNGIIHEINDIIVPRRRHRPEQNFQHPIDNFGSLFSEIV